MDTNGRIELIATAEDESDAKKRKLLSIPEGDIHRVADMNRKQRRAWAVQQRRKTST